MKCLVVGGGIAGLVSAYFAKQFAPDLDVTLIERNQYFGGLLVGCRYSEQGLYFDHGTHLFRESGDVELDQLFTSLVLPEELIQFEPGSGGHNGAIFSGRLQHNTHYPDLREIGRLKGVVESVVEHARTQSVPAQVIRNESLLENGYSRFGKRYTDEVLAPILSQLYNVPAALLSGFAMCLPGITRLVGHGYDQWYGLVEDPRLREVLGVPEQREMPACYENGLRRYYFSELGTLSLVNGMVERLHCLGVDLLSGVQLENCAVDGYVNWVCAGGQRRREQYDGIVFANGVVGAAAQLGISLVESGLEAPVSMRVLDIVLDGPVSSDLAYFYGFDTGSSFYRLTNYRAFSGDAKDCRLSVELLKAPVSNELECILTQLRSIGFIDKQVPVFSSYQPFKTAFSLPTTRNMLGLKSLRQKLHSVLPSNMLVVGVGAEEGLFFQNEVTLNAKNRVRQWLSGFLKV